MTGRPTHPTPEPARSDGEPAATGDPSGAEGTAPRRRTARRAARPATREGLPFEPVPEAQIVRELGLGPRPAPSGQDPLARQRAERPPHWE